MLSTLKEAHADSGPRAGNPQIYQSTCGGPLKNATYDTCVSQFRRGCVIPVLMLATRSLDDPVSTGCHSAANRDHTEPDCSRECLVRDFVRQGFHFGYSRGRELLWIHCTCCTDFDFGQWHRQREWQKRLSVCPPWPYRTCAGCSSCGCSLPAVVNGTSGLTVNI